MLRLLRCVITASFSETDKHNALTNGFVVFEYTESSEHLCSKFADASGPTVVGPESVIDFERSVIACDGKELAFAPLRAIAQELVVKGGAENVVKERLG